jgi:hypothetical protein
VAIKTLLVDLFLEAHARAPKQIILDLDATDDPLHGEQEGRFFHGHYDCYCYLPLYVFCGRHLLVAKLRRANLDAAAGAVEEVARVVARIRAHWPRTRILLRADSGFARDDLMTWCEANGVDFLFGLARNERLVAEITRELDHVGAQSRRTGRPERCFKSFMWTTRRSWSRRRRLVAKAEWTKGEANPRFVVTSLRRDECKNVYCARGEMENRIKECSSCSRSVRSCGSASVASRSPWHPPAPPRATGAAPPSGSPSPPSPAPDRHETRCRGAIVPRNHPQAHRDPGKYQPQLRPWAPQTSVRPVRSTSNSAYPLRNQSVG